MDELRQLKDRHDALPGADDQVVAQARARLLAHMSTPRHRPRFAWALGLGAAAVAAVLVAVIVIATPAHEGSGPVQAHPPSGSRPPATPLRLGPVASAEDLAGNAAALAAAAPDPVPEPGQWAYVKSRNLLQQPKNGTKNRTRTHELWRRADEKQFAYLEDGELKVVDGSEFEVTYPYLLSLPTDPAALLARTYAEVDAEHARHQAARRGGRATVPPLTQEQRHTYAFQHIVQGMRDAVLPRALRAAMYGALAGIPGVRYEARATDLAGRPGVTLYRVHEGYLRDEIFVDPETYEYLGYRTIAVRDFEQPRAYYSVEKGQLLGWGSVIASGVVDRPGLRP
ncbi:CU044_5270 family protein [Nonomuraea sp. NPDC050202]|uniref:CU044_5270 family protein n=1 Tax=Nonomuraea sp. NPDC050202 TaxID=3155035 RepID=UPI0033FC267F